MAITTADDVCECGRRALVSSASGSVLTGPFGLTQGIRNDTKLDRIWAECPCSCMAAANARAKDCCKQLKVDGACLDMCRRNLTLLDVIYILLLIINI
jgi:hypothetical protein